MSNSDPIVINAKRQALIALGAIGVAGFLVTSTATTFMHDYVNDFDGNFNAIPSDVTQRNDSLSALVDFSRDTVNSPIEFQNVNVTHRVDTTQPTLNPNIEKFGNGMNEFTVTSVGFAARSQRIENDQVRILNAIEQHAVNDAAHARNVLALTGISLSTITRVIAPATQELPNFVTYNANNDKEFSDRVAQVASRVSEDRALMTILSSTPLSVPIASAYRRTSPFGVRHDPFNGMDRFHAGVDMAVPNGTPVKVTATGRVTFAGWMNGYGNCVDVDHGNGFRTRYGHLSQINVRIGERVTEGHVIAHSGSTGHSTGPHLHYEVWYNGQVMDPQNFMVAGASIHDRRA